MKKAYIYPLTKRGAGMTNPYIHNFINALSKNINFLNADHPSNSGIINLIKYIFNVDYIFLNWPEDIPVKKGGLFQIIMLWFMINYAKLRNIKIIWTLHNRESHGKTKLRLRKFVRNFIMRKTDFVITHSKEGAELMQQMGLKKKTPVLFFHHPMLPVNSNFIIEKKKYDLLLWGTVEPYKGVYEFLTYLSKYSSLNLKIMIAGKIPDRTYKEKLSEFQNDRITIKDGFISDEDLKSYIMQSKIVLFTYLKSSVLSSGALMETLQYPVHIIGPNFAAFKDLSDEGIIQVYSDYNELLGIVLKLTNETVDMQKRTVFIEKYSWEKFGEASINLISK